MEGDIPFITFQKSKIELEETLNFSLFLGQQAQKCYFPLLSRFMIEQELHVTCLNLVCSLSK